MIELLEGKPPYHFLDPMPALFRIVQDDCPPIPEGISPVRVIAAMRLHLAQLLHIDRQGLPLPLLPERLQSAHLRQKAPQTPLDGFRTQTARVRKVSRRKGPTIRRGRSASTGME